MNANGIETSSQGSQAHVLRWFGLAILGVFLIMIGFAAGLGTMWFLGPELRRAGITAAAQSTTTEASQTLEERAGLLWEINSILQSEYLKPEDLDPQKMIYGAAAGMVASAGDPHTAFVEPVQAQILDEDMQGSFEGIGATVETIDDLLTIVETLPNSPALEAGLQAGDVILEADGQKLKGMDIMDAITLIRGPQGTVVNLKIQREGVAEPWVVPVTRDKVDLVTVETRWLDGDIAYLRLREFNAVSAKQVHEQLDQLMKQNPKGLILDLRGNPGGYLTMSTEIASEFLPKGDLILTERQRDKDPEEYRVTRRGLATEIPLVVLVNGTSASASEIVSGALRDHQRATLIGETTYGKGTVQNTHTLDDGSSLRVTIAEWLLPNGEHLEGQGIEPDIVIQRDLEAPEQDAQLDRAVQYLVEGK